MRNNVVEMTVLSAAINSPVIQFPGRQFPGVLVQGDSPKSMADLTTEIDERLRAGDLGEARLAAEELRGLLGSYISVYEQTLKTHGIALPYPCAG